MGNILKAAFKALHLIFVQYTGPGTYHIVDPETEAGIPILADYISFHRREMKIRVKDVGSDIIYLLTPDQFKNSLLETMAQNDPGLEEKLRGWFPFLRGEGDLVKYQSILRQLSELAKLDE